MNYFIHMFPYFDKVIKQVQLVFVESFNVDMHRRHLNQKFINVMALPMNYFRIGR